MKIALFTLIILGACELGRCADIFAAIPTPYYSHQATFRPLWRELAKRGHKITLVTTYPMEQNENITQLDYSKSFKDSFAEDVFKDGFNLIKLTRKMFSSVDKYLTNQFTHPGLQELVKNNKTFDLMLVELILPGWPLLSAKFKCPFIGLSTMDGHQMMHSLVGNAVHPAIYPYADLGIDEKNPSITDRLRSTGFALFNEIMASVLNPVGNSYVKSFIDKDLPDIREVLRNISMIFINSNPIFFPPRPVTPLTINFGGGLHFTEPKALPEIFNILRSSTFELSFFDKVPNVNSI